MNNGFVYLTGLAMLLTTSCATTSRPVHYYTLSPVAAPTVVLKPDGPTILVGAIITPESLQDSRIRYRAGSNETGSYEYHRWAERPGEMIRDSLVHTLRGAGKYQRVLESSSTAMGDYLLRGKLYEFAEVDQPAVQTLIRLHLDLVDTKTDRVIWSHPFGGEEPASGKTIEAVVQSMDRNLQQVVSAAAAEIARLPALEK
jgi:ABC-type uncharacterized transport system auxiliary subunit